MNKLDRAKAAAGDRGGASAGHDRKPLHGYLRYYPGITQCALQADGGTGIGSQLARDMVQDQAAGRSETPMRGRPARTDSARRRPGSPGASAGA